jgi:hypothetical protein
MCTFASAATATRSSSVVHCQEASLQRILLGMRLNLPNSDHPAKGSHPVVQTRCGCSRRYRSAGLQEEPEAVEMPWAVVLKALRYLSHCEVDWWYPLIPIFRSNRENRRIQVSQIESQRAGSTVRMATPITDDGEKRYELAPNSFQSSFQSCRFHLQPMQSPVRREQSTKTGQARANRWVLLAYKFRA